jgi:hypothetical protein
MASAEQSILFPVFSQLHSAEDQPTERDFPDDRLDRSEAESYDTAWQDFLESHAGVL